MKFISGYAFFPQNAAALAYGSNSQMLDKDCALSMWPYVLHQLLETSSMPSAQKTVCDIVGCAKQKQRESWILWAVVGDRAISLVCMSQKRQWSDIFAQSALRYMDEVIHPM